MRRRSIPLVIAIALFAPVAVHAHSPQDPAVGTDLIQLADRSNLIFIGDAEEVIYRNAHHVNKGDGTIPYTIVRYRISRVLRGKAPGGTITMRFLGGPDGAGGFLTASGVPTVQQGDRDLLFVDDSADAVSPLVFWEIGRFRILDDSVYDTNGSPVRGVLNSKVLARGTPPKEFSILRFPAPSFDELMKNPEVKAIMKARKMSVAEARKRYESEAPKAITIQHESRESNQKDDFAIDAPPPEPFKDTPPMALTKFIDAVLEAMKSVKRAPLPVASIDPDAKIVAPRFTQTVPLMLQPVVFTPKDADAAEFDALQRNDFNPVIKK